MWRLFALVRDDTSCVRTGKSGSSCVVRGLRRYHKEYNVMLSEQSASDQSANLCLWTKLS